MGNAVILGNTYPVRDKLKALGAKWDATAKAWIVSQDKAEKAREIVASAPKEKPEYTGKCLKCKGPVKAPYLVCYACKNPGYSQTQSNRRRQASDECPQCGSRTCSRAWNHNDLCDED